MKQPSHQAALDGIRGFAAFSVVLFHLGRWLGTPLAHNSGLAVDLFFLLSGYVLALAYDDRLATSMSSLRFIAVRLIRLMPLVVLGTLISAAYVMVRMRVRHDDIAGDDLALATLLGALNIPYLINPPGFGGGQIFPLNGPQYSLFFEVAVNAAWGAAGWLRRPWVTAVAAVVCLIAFVFIGVAGGDVPKNFATGFPRVAASFLGGAALYHLDRALPAWRGWTAVFWACTLVMAVLFYIPSEASFPVRVAWAALGSPLLVLSATRVSLRGAVRAIALWAGALSYPLYILHFPLFSWTNGIFQTLSHRRDVLGESLLVVAVAVVASTLAIRLYDEPLRRVLTRALPPSGVASHVSLGRESVRRHGEVAR